jgi:hypothetical protein
MSKHQEFHFFGANYAEWRTSENINEVIDWFKKQRNVKVPYTIWYVPTANGDNYPIEWYAPQVTGAICLGTYVKDKVWLSDEELAA